MSIPKSLKTHKVNTLTLNDPRYPASLKSIPSPPKQLYVRGSIEALTQPYVLAVIGSRKVSRYGIAVTESLVARATTAGAAIVSGLALGVDAIAHTACLDAGGVTIAVLPCGVDEIYPRSHFQLAERILTQGGAIVSEHEPGTPPYKNHFVARNRIVSGLSGAILITEAAARSGTLHTAHFALEQGRSVLAVPGNITSSTSAGTNQLIATGARIVTGSDDLLDELGLKQTRRSMPTPVGATAEETLLIKLLAKGISDGKELLDHSGMDVQAYNQTLTMLELHGKVKPLGANHWSLC